MFPQEFGPFRAIGFLVLGGCAWAHGADVSKPQYEFGDIKVPAFRASEPVRPVFSAALAEDYLRQGALAWKGSKSCISCHTTGLYLTVRPALAPFLGRPLEKIRDFFLAELRTFQKMPAAEIAKSTRPAQVVYLAAGLAEWDAHVRKRLSPETEEALALMFAIQQTNGTWGSLDCWPPYESDSYHLATVAAMAVGTAPGWLPVLGTNHTKAGAGPIDGVNRLRAYFKSTPPPHDYGRALLLWASTRLSGLQDAAQQRALVEVLRGHQRPDGGWSLRTFAAPEAWGRGNRAEKLRGELEFKERPSDGHQTGLVILVLREAGVAANDRQIQRGVKWLKENQRESGRWWTRSLNTDAEHYISYSGTAFPLLALARCGELPQGSTDLAP